MPYSHLSNSVISGGEPTEHEVTMLEKEGVSVRDGDDFIDVKLDSEETQDEDRITVNVDTTGSDDSGSDSDSDTDSEGNPDEGTQGESQPDEELPEFPEVDGKDVVEAAKLVSEAQAGQEAIIAKAMEAGLTQEAFDAIQGEVAEGKGLSDESYAALEAAGFSKTFVDSYMAGQQAIGESFAKSVMAYVGGEDNFAAMSEFLLEKHPNMVDAINAAVERFDSATITALLDSAKTLMGSQKSVGKVPSRNLAAAAKPSTTSAKAADEVVGFTSRQEMVKAMSDPRYQRDAKYRREVELKVFRATF